MQTASSARRVWRHSSSAWLYTATVPIPSSRQARITRTAISPRLAMRIFLNIQSLLMPGVDAPHLAGLRVEEVGLAADRAAGHRVGDAVRLQVREGAGLAALLAARAGGQLPRHTDLVPVVLAAHDVRALARRPLRLH